MRAFEAEGEFQLRVFVGVGRKFFEEEAGLDVGVVLIFVAVVFGEVAADVVVEDLADLDAGVDTDGLHGEHFEGPVSAEAHVAETGGDVHKKPQPADRGAALDHRHQIVRFGAFDGAAQIELIGLQHESLGRNLHPPHAIGLAHVEDQFLVDHQFVVQGQIIAVGIKPRGIERLENDVPA